MSEEFGSNIDEKKEFVSKFRKIKYLKLSEGERLVRILDKMETKHYTHYLNGSYVTCLGDECPICKSNKKIIYEHPEDFREVKGWSPRRDRYYINVMDRTVGKICEKCETETSAKADVCPACGTVLGVAKPLNVIKVMSGSRQFFESLKVISKSIRNEQDEAIDIRTYDWLLITSGAKKEKRTVTTPRYNSANVALLEFPQEELYDLNDVIIKLSPEEMIDLSGGTSLKDIFIMRKAKKNDEEVDFLSPDDDLDLQNSVNEIFKTE